ncbi:MAG: leucine-rich repeat domain-containing protein, partial [Ruminococcus sp.]|nr:leucine-rich repeat domain-containing protein [Ruminococcus sp.]
MNKSKRAIAVILAILMMTGTSQAGLTAAAAENTESTQSVSAGAENDDSGTCGTNAKYEFDGATGTLTISGEGAMTNFSTTSAPWNSYKNIIKKIIIEDGITNLPSYIFSDHTNLEKVVLSKNITNYGYYIFSGCINLKRAEIYSNMQNGYGIFWGCKALSEVYIDPSVTYITNSIFEGINNTSTITVEGKSSSYAEAFAKDMKYDFIANGENIYEGECGENATYKFENYTLTISGKGEFTNYSSNSATPWYNYRHIIRNIIIEDGITNLPSYIFSDHTNLEKVVLSKNITNYGYYIFSGCINLKRAEIYSNMQNGYGIFWGCKALSEVYIDPSVTYINSGIFDGINNTSTITIEGKSSSYAEAL